MARLGRPLDSRHAETVYNKNKPLKDRALQDLEEAPPSMKAEELKRAASSYKANTDVTDVGAEGFHPKAPLDVRKETCGEMVVFLSKVEKCGHWPVQASSLLFLFQTMSRAKDQLLCELLSFGGGNGREHHDPRAEENKQHKMERRGKEAMEKQEEQSRKP